MIKEEYNKEYNTQFGVLTFFATLLAIFGHHAFGIIYAMFGLLIPLLISYFINFIKKRINKI